LIAGTETIEAEPKAMACIEAGLESSESSGGVEGLEIDRCEESGV